MEFIRVEKDSKRSTVTTPKRWGEAAGRFPVEDDLCPEAALFS